MSLSSGTLNLKFMQRAAARSGAPNSPAAAAPSSAGATESEDANKWVLPRRKNAEAGPSKPRVQFVASYMPFLEAGEAEGAEGGDGGRRSFGGFGKKEKEKVDEEGERGDEDDSEDELDYESEGEKRRKQKRAEKENDMDVDAKPRTFQRPSGFDSPKSNGGKPTKPKSQADKLRATISGMKSVSMSPSSSREGSNGSVGHGSPSHGSSSPAPRNIKRQHQTSGESTPKRFKAEVKEETGDKAKNKIKKEDKAAGKDVKSKAKEDRPKVKADTPNAKTSLDERERAIKAAKKAEKKAKRKA